MDSSNLALAVLALSFAAGMIAANPPEIPELGSIQSSSIEAAEEDNSSLEYGTAHEHALFYVVVNGTALDFTAERYQLRSKYVHLENNRSQIVHKHSEGVTWNRFLETINASVNRSSGTVCFERYNGSYCGNGTVRIEGGNLSSEIDQGEHLVVVIGGDVNATVEEYSGRELPPAYMKETRGYRV